MPFLADAITLSVRCPCGRWEWREPVMASAPGFIAVERRCPRCRTRSLAVFRVSVGVTIRPRLLGVVPLTGTNPLGIRAALRRFAEIDEDSVEFMVAVAERLARAKPA